MDACTHTYRHTHKHGAGKGSQPAGLKLLSNSFLGTDTSLQHFLWFCWEVEWLITSLLKLFKCQLRQGSDPFKQSFFPRVSGNLRGSEMHISGLLSRGWHTKFPSSCSWFNLTQAVKTIKLCITAGGLELCYRAIDLAVDLCRLMCCSDWLLAHRGNAA